MARKYIIQVESSYEAAHRSQKTLTKAGIPSRVKCQPQATYGYNLPPPPLYLLIVPGKRAEDACRLLGVSSEWSEGNIAGIACPKCQSHFLEDVTSRRIFKGGILVAVFTLGLLPLLRMIDVFMNRYDRDYCCDRCGHVFRIDRTASITSLKKSRGH